jgi:putative acetyltransferase
MDTSEAGGILMSTIRVRHAKLGDCLAMHRLKIAAIHCDWPNCYSKQEIEAWCKQLGPDDLQNTFAGRETFVAEADGYVVAFGQLDRNRSNVDALYVAPSQMYRGLGTKLLCRLEEAAMASGLSQLQLSASLSAVPFYLRCGYKPNGTRTFTLVGGGELLAMHMVKTMPLCG